MPKTKTDKSAPSFEQSLAELTSLVAKMESGELSLEQSIASYKRGVELVNSCTAQLAAVEKQIEILDGKLVKPFSVEANGADHD